METSVKKKIGRTQYVLASNDASAFWKDYSNRILTGTADQTLIQSALDTYDDVFVVGDFYHVSDWITIGEDNRLITTAICMPSASSANCIRINLGGVYQGRIDVKSSSWSYSGIACQIYGNQAGYGWPNDNKKLSKMNECRIEIFGDMTNDSAIGTGTALQLLADGAAVDGAFMTGFNIMNTMISGTFLYGLYIKVVAVPGSPAANQTWINGVNFIGGSMFKVSYPFFIEIDDTNLASGYTAAAGNIISGWQVQYNAFYTKELITFKTTYSAADNNPVSNVFKDIVAYDPPSLTTGTATFTNGDATVTLSSAVLLSAKHAGCLIWDTTEGILAGQIDTVTDTTHCELKAVYAGTGGSGHTYVIRPAIVNFGQSSKNHIDINVIGWDWIHDQAWTYTSAYYMRVYQNTVSDGENLKKYLAEKECTIIRTNLYTDHTWNGLTRFCTWGETVAFGQVCYLKSDGKFWLAKADAEATTAGLLVIALEAGVASGIGLGLLRGEVKDASWSYAVGSPLWISDATAGLIDDAKPSTEEHFLRCGGFATATNQCGFYPDNVYVEIPA